MWTSWAQSLLAKIRGKIAWGDFAPKEASAKQCGIWRKIFTSSRMRTKLRFYTPIEARVMQAPTSKSPEEREFVVDSGASMNMMSKKDLSLYELDTLRRSRNRTVVLTANGQVHTNEEAQVNVHDLNLLVIVQLLEETLAVLSHGKLCEDHGFSHGWVSSQEATVDQRREDNGMHNRQHRTSCCCRVIHQFWKRFVGNIDIAGFVNKSSSTAKWRTTPKRLVRINTKNPNKNEKRIGNRDSDDRLWDLP